MAKKAAIKWVVGNKADKLYGTYLGNDLSMSWETDRYVARVHSSEYCSQIIALAPTKGQICAMIYAYFN